MENTVSKPSESDALNVVEILNLFFAKLQVNAESDSIWLQGIYEPGNDRQYGNYFYDKIKDVNSAEYINLLVPPLLRPKLKPKNEIKIRGILSKRLREGGAIHLAFIAAHLEYSVAQSADPVLEEQWKRLQIRAQIPRKDVDYLIQNQFAKNEKPVIVIFTGESSIVTEEFFNQLGPSIDEYEIEIIRTNLKKPEQLAKDIRKVDIEHQIKYIALMRGGGEGLECFNNPELADSILNSNNPVLSALGHATDNTLAKQLADKIFDTPTAFGTWLKNVHERFAEHQANSKALLLEQVRKTTEQEIRLLEEQKIQLSRALESKEKNLEALQNNQKSQNEQNQQLHKHIQELSMQFKQASEQHISAQKELQLLRSELTENTKQFEIKIKATQKNHKLMLLIVALISAILGILAGFLFPPSI
jgi:exodeoxyribonuclease VII large subunit